MSEALVPSVLYSTLRGTRSVQHHGQRPSSAVDVTSYVRSLHVRVLRLWKYLTIFITDNIDPTFLRLEQCFIWFH